MFSWCYDSDSQWCCLVVISSTAKEETAETVEVIETLNGEIHTTNLVNHVYSPFTKGWESPKKYL